MGQEIRDSTNTLLHNAQHNQVLIQDHRIIHLGSGRGRSLVQPLLKAGLALSTEQSTRGFLQPHLEGHHGQSLLLSLADLTVREGVDLSTLLQSK